MAAGDKRHYFFGEPLSMFGELYYRKWMADILKKLYG
jgi:hypothetical protein